MKNLKMMSKLLIMIVIVGLIPLYVSTLFTHHNEKGEIVHAIEDKNAFFATLVSSNLEEYIYECESQAKLAASTINIVTSVRTLKSDTINDVYRDDVALVTGAIYEQFGYYDIYLTDKNGFVVYSYANPSFETQDLSLNPEIMQSITGTPAWSDLSYSEVDGRNIIRFSTPVYNGSSVIGTANIAIDQTSINLLIQNRVESLGQTGDAYLVDATGLLYTDTRLGDYTQNASLTQTISTKAVERLSEEITAGNLDYHYSGTYKDYRGEEVNGNLSVVKMGNQFYGLIIEVDTAESYSVVDTVIIVVYATLTVSALLSVSVAIIMALSITKPLGKLVKSANRLSTYDISEDLPLSLRKRKDEIGTLAKSIQEITDNLRSLLNEINATSSNVAASSEELTASAEQAATASSEVATTIGEIARGANDQADQTTLGADTLSQLSELVKEESLTIERVHSSMGTVQNSVSEGLTIIRDLNEKNKLSSEASLFVQQSVSQTSVSAHKIGEASTLIASIAEQTNLLSLNAAIEAARAGEAGRGFAVVADQIRQLADQSTRSTQTIDTIIKEVLKSIDTAVSKTSEAVSMLEEQTQIVHMTANKFNQISEATQETEKAISIMSDNSKRIAENNANVQEIIHTLSAVAEENAASTEEASAAVEEQSAMIQQISGASENLATLAQELSDQIAKFKLS